MKRLFHVSSLLVVCMLLASAASAQLSVETAMRGNTFIAAPTAASAWVMNPAMLGSRAPAGPSLAGGMQHSVSVDLEVSGDTDVLAVNWAGARAGGGLGIGAGYWDFSGFSIFGAGVGKPMGRASVGLNWTRFDNAVSQNLLNLGVAGSFSMSAGRGGAASWGLVVRDLTDQTDLGPWFDIGAASTLPDGTLIALDVHDLTGEVDRTFHVGASKPFGKANEYTVGLGLSDGNLTLGAMYDLSAGTGGRDWKVGVAWMSTDSPMKDSIIIGASGSL